MHGLTTCCEVLIIWIHSDCFCKQMLQILFLIKYQGLDSNIGPCQHKIAQILALGPNPTKDGCECLKHCRLPSLVGRLARHWDIMQESGFWGVSQVPGWECSPDGCLTADLCMDWAWHSPVRLEWAASHIINNHHYKFLQSLRKIQQSKSSQELKEELWAELSLKQFLLFSYHLMGFFLLVMAVQ